ncbi:MAG: ATP-binding cassette domain-containing protein [Candidatus Paceibacterota bacterium]
MSNKLRTPPKIRVEHLFKIIGDQPEKANELLDTGASKAEIFKRTGQTAVLRDISFNANEGEIFVLTGQSGSHGSALLRCLNGLLQPTHGFVRVGSTEVTGLSDDTRRTFRQKTFGMVFRKPALLQHRTVLENVSFGLEMKGVSKHECTLRGHAVLEVFDLAKWAETPARELSVSMQQQVSLARAHAIDPEVLLMDEPFSEFDPPVRIRFQEKLLALHATLGTTILFATHDLNEAVRIGDRIGIVDEEGRLVQTGAPEEILLHPANRSVEALLSNVDRSSVIRVESLMRPSHHVLYETKTPTDALKHMDQTSTDYVFVVASGNGLRGIVTRDRATNAAERSATLADITRATDITHTDRTIKEVLPHVLDSNRPIAVLNSEEQFVGEVSRSEIAKILKKQHAQPLTS